MIKALTDIPEDNPSNEPPIYATPENLGTSKPVFSAHPSNEASIRMKIRSILIVAELDRHNWDSAPKWADVTVDAFEQLIKEYAKKLLQRVEAEVIGEDEAVYDTPVKANNKSVADYLRYEQREALSKIRKEL